MRVAIVAESFLPNINGVTNSILRILEHLHEHGHQAIVIAPGARDFQEEIPDYLGFPIHRVPTIMVPLINSLPIGLPLPRVYTTLRAFQPDVIHLASPYVLGWAGVLSARALNIPCVAVYQTDIAGFAQRYHLAPLTKASWRWTKALHNRADRTLAPSSPTIDTLTSHGIENVYRWGRGVDTTLFNPTKRSSTLRAQWDPTGTKHIVGYVGRLAAEKGIARLAALADEPTIQLVIVGDGPDKTALKQHLPDAIFCGHLAGEDLAAAYASFDAFIHPGEYETFCQAIQEALASGVPAIAPRAGGPIDLIQPGHNGYLLPVETFTRELAPTLHQLLDPDTHQRMSAAARAGVAARTWPRHCATLLEHYQAVIAV